MNISRLPFSVVQKCFCITCLFFCFHARSQEAMARVSLATNDTIWAGQKVTLVVELLAPGFFSSAATFDLPDPQNVLLLPPTEHPVVGSETISGIAYTVQRHELSVFAAKSGELTIPAMNVRFTFKRAPLDTNTISATVTTTPIQFTVSQPPGTENLGNVISARDLKAEETWQPEPGDTNVLAGTAFKRTLTFTAPDVPGMVFPPFRAGQIDGLGIYTKRQVLDETDRGTLNGGRRDTITYVCQRPGQFTIPAASLIWFDLDSHTLHTNVFPARTFTVIANPAMASVASTVGMTQTTPGLRTATRWKISGAAFVLLLILLVVCSTTLRRQLAGLFSPFRPVHLQPLNPTETK